MKQAAPKGAAIILGVINIKHICLFETYSDLMTVKEVADAMGLGKTKVYSLIKTGEIKTITLGNTYKIPKTWLIEYIDSLWYNTDMEQELSTHQESEVLKHDGGQLTA